MHAIKIRTGRHLPMHALVRFMGNAHLAFFTYNITVDVEFDQTHSSGVWSYVEDARGQGGDEGEEGDCFFVAFDGRDEVGGVYDIGALVEGLEGVDW